MKRASIYFGGLAVVLMATLAFAAGYSGSTNNDLVPRWMKGGMFVGSAGPGDTKNRVTRVLGATATVDFTSAYDGVAYSSAITVTGALVGDRCQVGMPAAAAALKANFECHVTAADEVKISFQPADISAGTAALVSGTPSTQTATVTASSICVVSPLGLTAVIAGAGIAWSVTTTTATFTGPDTVTTTFAYRCMAPVDPASGTFTVTVTSHQ